MRPASYFARCGLRKCGQYATLLCPLDGNFFFLCVLSSAAVVSLGDLGARTALGSIARTYVYTHSPPDGEKRRKTLFFFFFEGAARSVVCGVSWQFKLVCVWLAVGELAVLRFFSISSPSTPLCFLRSITHTHTHLHKHKCAEKKPNEFHSNPCRLETKRKHLNSISLHPNKKKDISLILLISIKFLRHNPSLVPSNKRKKNIKKEKTLAFFFCDLSKLARTSFFFFLDLSFFFSRLSFRNFLTQFFFPSLAFLTSPPVFIL